VLSSLSAFLFACTSAAPTLRLGLDPRIFPPKAKKFNSRMSNFSNQIRASAAMIKRLRLTSSNPVLMRPRSFTTTEGDRPTIVHKRSLDILHDPWFNKVNLHPIALRLNSLILFEFNRVLFFIFSVSEKTVWIFKMTLIIKLI
jgi:hypothetical protein